jgi:hypothetical protein
MFTARAWDERRDRVGSRVASGRGGRMHSAGTGLAEPDPDASFVAEAVASRLPRGQAKAIVGEMLGFRGGLSPPPHHPRESAIR